MTRPLPWEYGDETVRANAHALIRDTVEDGRAYSGSVQTPFGFVYAATHKPVGRPQGGYTMLRFIWRGRLYRAHLAHRGITRLGLARAAAKFAETVAFRAGQGAG